MSCSSCSRMWQCQTYSFLKGLVGNHQIRGITERLGADGKYSIFGSRDGLANLPDVDIQKFYMDDVSKVTEAFDQFKQVTAKPPKKR